MYSMGNWDECLRISEYNVKGQYCLVNATFDPLKSEPNPDLDQLKEKASVWDALKKGENEEKIIRLKIGLLTEKKNCQVLATDVILVHTKHFNPPDVQIYFLEEENGQYWMTGFAKSI
ncbi:hypothetical protein V9T40_005469 [Parthenolecanium corni]|uniref:Uncharacterized protein n=1 Tax=Parthenolecanium corni TaxID=536013 RepID=A0AAN9THE6_9HEMI